MNECISQTFFALLRAGLFKEHEAKCSINGLDAAGWDKLYTLAEEQGVTGLIASGIDRLNVDAPLVQKLQFVGSSLQIEQANKELNAFIADIVNEMRDAGIYALIVKGQGIAQCYENPLWRPSGDVDFLLDEVNYKKADEYLSPKSTYRKFGGRYSKEIGLGFDRWTVELHASLRTGLSAKVDSVVDEVFEDTFKNNKVRTWKNGDTEVLLPASDEDVFFVFTHFIKHFYKEGMNLRQLCDWCRLLWMYKESLNLRLLEQRIKKAGLVDEWRVFAVLAVRWLGMPEEAMPLYNENDIENEKGQAERLVEFILSGYSGNKVKDTFQIAKIFPWKAFRFSLSIFLNLNVLKVKERLSLN